MFRSPFGLTVCALMLSCGLVSAAEPNLPAGEVRQLIVFPSPILLNGSRTEQRVGVLGTHADGRQWDYSGTARFASGNSAVATVDASGIVRPAGDGSTKVVITAGGASASVPVTVTGFKSDEPINFTRDVETVLTKAGCNQGACHGAAIGRGGFRLSLRGYDPTFDHSQTVQSAEGRRVVLGQPERSILLLKPSLAMEHGGGERLKNGSVGYATLKAWLEDGAPQPSSNDPHVTKLEAWPPRRVMVPGERQRLVVCAHWSDGRITDATPWATFDSLQDAVAAVTPTGIVTGKARVKVMSWSATPSGRRPCK